MTEQRNQADSSPGPDESWTEYRDRVAPKWDSQYNSRSVGEFALALWHGNEEEASHCIRMGLNVEDKFQGRTPLDWAAELGSVRTLSELLEHGQRLAEWDLASLLELSIRADRQDAVKLLLSRGANVNYELFVGTPLTWACQRGVPAMVALLLDAGAHVNARCEKSPGRMTPLMTAAESAGWFKSNYGRETWRRMMGIESWHARNLPGFAGRAPDSAQVESNVDHVAVAGLLLRRGADPSMKAHGRVGNDNVDGFRALELAQRGFNGESDPAMVRLLTEHSKSRAGCFIATAVYGSYDSPEVRVLRQFRDQALAPRTAGRLAIAVYYKIGPQLVRAVGRRTMFQRVMRPALDNLVRALQSRGYGEIKSSRS